MNRLKTYLELMRPFTLLAPMVGFLSGAIIASRGIPRAYALVGSLAALMLNAASNVNNQYFDLEIDRINKPSRPLCSGRISKKETIIFASTLYILALFLSWLINLQFFVIASITAVITFLYSAPPVRIKKYPFASNIFIAIPRGMLLIVAGWSVIRPISCMEPWFIGLIFAIYITGAASTKDFSDIKGDAACGIRSLPVLYGPEKTAKIISPFFYAPFLLIPIGVVFNIIKATTLPLTLMAIWGIHTAKLITKNPEALTLERNHVSWKHMYLMLIVGQIGFALAYIIKT